MPQLLWCRYVYVFRCDENVFGSSDPQLSPGLSATAFYLHLAITYPSGQGDGHTKVPPVGAETATFQAKGEL